MLESDDIDDILKQFPPITFAFAYGSGVITQSSYDYKKQGSSLPMIDLIFAVDNSVEWHKENMKVNKSHYSPCIPMSPYMITYIQEKFGASVWFNTLIPSNLRNSPSRLMKYGVISTKDLVDDLEQWKSLYCAGRLQKPVQIIKGNKRIEEAIETTKQSAIITSLLLLHNQFAEKDLYFTIASLSYVGDPRMLIGENPKKVRNLVEPILPEYKRFYSASLQNVRIQNKLKLYLIPNGVYHQDISNRQILFEKLPTTMRKLLQAERRTKYSVKPPSRGAIRTALAGIVSKSAFTQSFKGLITAGVYKSGEYILKKLSKSLLKPFFS